MSRSKRLILFACGALAADASWLAARWIAPADPMRRLPHWAMPASERSVEFALKCGTTSLRIEDGSAHAGPILLLEDNKTGLSIADCVRHQSGGTVPIRKVRTSP